MKITWSQGIDIATIQEFEESLGKDLNAALDERGLSYRSPNAPSFVQLLADAPWWAQLLGTAASLLVAEIIKEAGKDAWKQKSKLAAVVAAAGAKMLRLGSSIVSLRENLPKGTTIAVGLPIPDDIFGLRLNLGESGLDLVDEITIFALYLPLIEKAIERNALSEGKVTGAIFASLHEDLSLKIAWMDRGSLRIIEERLQLEDHF